MGRSYKSGATKRKNKAIKEENIKKHRKLDSFLLRAECHASTEYKDWKNSGASIQGHEHSSDQRKASLAYFYRKNKKLSSGSGKTNYLSKKTFNELTVLMARKVLQSISNDVLKSKYYGLSVDSTPDASHKDQLCVILRYIDQISNEPIERFVNFIHIDNHTGENLANATVDFLNAELNLEISNCRSQSYDNSSNMTGKYKGMKTRILEFNRLAKLIELQNSCHVQVLIFSATIFETSRKNKQKM
ncbi:uncharacterized protein LOC136091981 [Hydra vulgaris]|uniref:Uncharacterized protein LOC136091981 n=1 Tax=Hydra vulgaris TaxID=6087 RepID=A0ABM4DMH7_HYDVU